MSDNEVFADVFKQFLFHGERVLTLYSLTSVDTSAFTVLYGETGPDISVQRFCDVMKFGIAKKKYIFCLELRISLNFILLCL